MNAAVETVTRRFTTAQLVERLNAVGVPCGPIYDIGAAFEDAQAKHLRMTTPAPHPKLGDVQLVRTPINLSGFPHADRFHHAGPDPGEHSAEVLLEFGLDEGQIARLMAAGAIA